MLRPPLPLLLLLLLLLLLPLALAACSADPPADKPAAPPAAPTRATPPPPAAEPEPPAPAPPPPAPDGATAAAPDRTPEAPPPPDKGPPRDLQVLPKDWSRAQVTAYMKKQVVPALGVKCDFCHEADYAKDTKHKETARRMIILTDDINRTWFKGKSRVSCMTCHLGKKEPVEP